MGRRDWGYVNLPKLLLKRMDKFVESSQARKIGVFNKSQLVRKLVVEFLVEQEKHYDNMESIDEFIGKIGCSSIWQYHKDPPSNKYCRFKKHTSCDKNNQFYAGSEK